MSCTRNNYFWLIFQVTLHNLTCSYISLFTDNYSINGMVKVQNLKKRMERFNEVVNGLKEGKQEMARRVQELAVSIEALLAKIKVSQTMSSPDRLNLFQKSLLWWVACVSMAHLHLSLHGIFGLFRVCVCAHVCARACVYYCDKTLSSSFPAPPLGTPLMSRFNTVTSCLPADCLTSTVGNWILWLQCVSQHYHVGKLRRNMESVMSHGESPTHHW